MIPCLAGLLLSGQVTDELPVQNIGQMAGVTSIFLCGKPVYMEDDGMVDVLRLQVHCGR